MVSWSKYFLETFVNLLEKSWLTVLMRYLTCQRVKDVCSCQRISCWHQCLSVLQGVKTGYSLKAALSSLFLKLKSSFSFTVTLINIHNDPSQFPPCSLRFVAARMLYSTEVSTWVLYLMRSTSCFISWVPSLLESGTKRPCQENEEELEIRSADLLDTLHS